MYHKQIERFPDTFLFGASTSSFQVEGGQTSGGRGEALHDRSPKKAGITDFSTASDHYHRWEEDIDLFHELGLKVYRFSMSWTRIMPDGKNVNQEGLAFYDKIVDKLVGYGIEPLVTIYHFEYPSKLVDDFGGWLSPKSIDAYEEFANVLFTHFGDRVKYWLTINEQDHVIKISERLGLSKESEGVEFEGQVQQANYYMCVATAKVIKLAHEIIPNVKIGPAVNPMPAIPASANPLDVIASMTFNELSHYYILDLHCRGKFSPIHWKYMEDRDICPEVKEEELQLMAENTPDFIGINYYLNQTVAHSEKEKIELRGQGVFMEEEAGIYKLVENKEIPQTDWGWNICPEGLSIALMDVYNRYQLPMLITENGLGAYDEVVEGEIHDTYRIDFLANHLKQIKDCLSLGFPIIGYCAWSAIDLVSGREGMDKRYGFIYVNRTNDELRDLNRIKKDSFYWYQNVIQERGYSL
ncbi:glycoside hydrolase family 1 protein [Enterococcus termitis]|uniref:6-phospho-beta-glucosidase n=1 Tax=Enterococcus termitis TaxID=332950 RepID=A0A1E5GHR0_9ENTE|nr:glycoside hydrolase family 1 protein [Enterococcus termitis]OEG12242.1 6-phospho-beta-glucosidase [Enterococcus termitis]OJG98947.1 glycoside hydrolase family 1 [Enterococcus termitis]